MYEGDDRCYCPGLYACELAGPVDAPTESVQCRVLLEDDIVFDLMTQEPDRQPRWERCEAWSDLRGVAELEQGDGVDDDCDGLIDE